ncbi:MAG: hypothetical protein JWP97_6414 [Labilithrix sp.]|nr:hypothetical protein [Labilithrix sp.]
MDLPPIDGKAVTLDVTETSIVAQRFQPREGEDPGNQGYFAWLNRLNAVLSWKRLTLGARIDSGLYAFRPEDRSYSDPQEEQRVRADGATRYRNGLYVAKLYLTYKTPDTEITVGDAYAQLGRGLVLSLRKVDELGIDTTLLGVKVSTTKDIFAFTLLAGLTNPSRIDEPSGRSLFVSSDLGDTRGPQPVFGNDRIVGASVVAGRGHAVVLSTNAMMLTRCAPYRYDQTNGRIIDDTFDRPFGTCNDDDREIFLQSVPTFNPVSRSKHVVNASQTLEVPSLWGHGNLYVEAAVQKRERDSGRDDDTNGNALYAAFTTSGGPVTNTFELKSYRNFFPVGASVNNSRATEFANVAYSAPPTAEPVIADTMLNSFNVCVTGGRDRLDYRINNQLLVYGTLGYFYSLTEQPGGQCDEMGRSTAASKDTSKNYVTDVSAGTELRFDDDQSYVFFNVNARHDVKGDGNAYYRELSAQYTFSKHIAGPYSFELAGRHRYRIQADENVPGGATVGAPWWQGEHQNALKIAPRWILSQGFEYTTQQGFPTYYVNGGVLYKFTSQSNIRLYAGQNRGGLRCVSGICRQFPAFSGARAELTYRF